MKKVPFDLRGMTATDFAKTFRVGGGTVSGWKMYGEMPYWASVVPIGHNPELARRDAEIARLNIVIDELINRVAR